MSEEISIGKIEIKINKKTISLTVDQAKELKQILNDTFPVVVDTPIVIEKHIFPWRENYPATPFWDISYPYYRSTTGDVPINNEPYILGLSICN